MFCSLLQEAHSNCRTCFMFCFFYLNFAIGYDLMGLGSNEMYCMLFHWPHFSTKTLIPEGKFKFIVLSLQ